MHVLWRLLWRSAGAAENLEVFFWRTAFDFVKHRLDPFGPCRSDTICTSMWLPQQQDVCLLPRVPKSAHKKHLKSEVFPGVMGLSDSLLSCTAQDRDLHILACCNVALTQHMEHAERGLWMLREAAQRLKPRSQEAKSGAWKQCPFQPSPRMSENTVECSAVCFFEFLSFAVLILFAPVRPQAWVQRNSFRSVASEQGAY